MSHGWPLDVPPGHPLEPLVAEMGARRTYHQSTFDRDVAREMRRLLVGAVIDFAILHPGLVDRTVTCPDCELLYDGEADHVCLPEDI